ncbi:MAG: diguanylate cyclase domain-containing protein [Ilumatobacteraceae bacterium]
MSDATHDHFLSTAATVTGLGRLRMLSRIAEQVGEGVAVVDNEAWIVYANDAFLTMHRCTLEQLQASKGSVFYSPDEWDGPVQSLMGETLRHGVGRAELTRCRADGTSFAAHVTLSLLHDDGGTLAGRVLCVQDITVRKHLEAQLHRAALHDPLTDLPNRRLLLDRLEHALAMAPRVGAAVAVLFIDLDGFKVVNDSHGHEVGDQLLIQCADRLQGCLRDADTVARLGGDEFVVLLEGVAYPEEPQDVAQRLLRVLVQPFKLDGATVRISASIGVATGISCTPRSLLHDADSAMYEAKGVGAGQIITSTIERTSAFVGVTGLEPGTSTVSRL